MHDHISIHVHLHTKMHTTHTPCMLFLINIDFRIQRIKWQHGIMYLVYDAEQILMIYSFRKGSQIATHLSHSM